MPYVTGALASTKMPLKLATHLSRSFFSALSRRSMSHPASALSFSRRVGHLVLAAVPFLGTAARTSCLLTSRISFIFLWALEIALCTSNSEPLVLPSTFHAISAQVWAAWIISTRASLESRCPGSCSLAPDITQSTTSDSASTSVAILVVVQLRFFRTLARPWSNPSTPEKVSRSSIEAQQSPHPSWNNLGPH